MPRLSLFGASRDCAARPRTRIFAPAPDDPGDDDEPTDRGTNVATSLRGDGAQSQASRTIVLISDSFDDPV